MSVVIIGGNECMEGRYRQICKTYGYKAKVFTKMPANFKKQIGCPDLLVLFTSTVSHKMVGSALQEAGRSAAAVARSHSSSACALQDILRRHRENGACFCN
ncbi:MAG: DUF2325 domain-containing protein [Eubacteriales bacterium]